MHDYNDVVVLRSLDQKDENSGRIILTILYLCVLGLCFVVPVFYYCRMHHEERSARRMREMELAGITEALEHSETNREETRAARRKYREERRARIIQLFAPVRMILKEEHFPHLRNRIMCPTEDGSHNETLVLKGTRLEDNATSEEGDDNDSMNRIEEGMVVGCNQQEELHNKGVLIPSGNDDVNDDDSSVENTLMIEIPAPGLYVKCKSDSSSGKLRQVPIVCSICLCNYKVGSDIVWSSNNACDHVFHEHCIEQWIMKQREGPLCPCCRRDFVLDPFDLEDGDEYVPSMLTTTTTIAIGNSTSQNLEQGTGHDNSHNDDNFAADGGGGNAGRSNDITRHQQYPVGAEQNRNQEPLESSG